MTLSTQSSSCLKKPAHLPRHVGLLMDGNGRWAQARGLSRQEGHKQGVVTLRRAVEYACQIGIEYLTLFSFSSENWGRPSHEVTYLMGLLRRFVDQDLEVISSRNIRVHVIGRRDNLSSSVKTLLTTVEEKTKNNTGMRVIVAFNYGARDELVRAMRRVCREMVSGKIASEDITESLISTHLDTGDFPDPDLLIRTGAECRLSNFLLWQAAYAELIFLPICWPDFDEKAFDAALEEYAQRERRYGRLISKDAGCSHA